MLMRRYPPTEAPTRSSSPGDALLAGTPLQELDPRCPWHLNANDLDLGSSGLPSYSSRSKSPSGASLQLEYPDVIVLTEALQAILQEDIELSP